MSTHLLGSTILMALLLVAIFVAVSRIGSGNEESAGLPARRSESRGERVASTVDTPAGLGAIFVVLTVTAGLLAVAAVGGPGGLLPGTFALTVGLFGLLLVGFLFVGSYVVVRQHGLGPAQGVAVGLFGVGGAGILLVAANLVFGFVG